MFTDDDTVLEVQPDRVRREVGAHMDRSMDKIRLLVIDDHIGVRDALQVSLSNRTDLEVLTAAADPGSLMQTVDTVTPEVVIFEPKNVNGEGVDTCRRILAAECQPVVLVLTSYRDEQEEMNLVELGVSRYLLKEVDSQRLYEEILAAHAERRASKS